MLQFLQIFSNNFDCFHVGQEQLYFKDFLQQFSTFILVVKNWEDELKSFVLEHAETQSFSVFANISGKILHRVFLLVLVSSKIIQTNLYIQLRILVEMFFFMFVNFRRKTSSASNIATLFLKQKDRRYQQRYSIKTVSVKVFQNSRENTCARASFLIKLQVSASDKLPRLWLRCFPVNYGKFLTTPCLQNISVRLLLKSKFTGKRNKQLKIVIL